MICGRSNQLLISCTSLTWRFLSRWKKASFFDSEKKNRMSYAGLDGERKKGRRQGARDGAMLSRCGRNWL